MASKRSEEAYLRTRKIREANRQLRKTLLDTSYRDRDLAETISRTHIHCEDLQADHGDVLLDSRGRGTLQQISFGR